MTARERLPNPEAIRSALCRDSHGRASGPLGAAHGIIATQIAEV